MFEKNGLKPIRVYGDYKLNEYQVETSPRLILLAQKTGQGRDVMKKQNYSPKLESMNCHKDSKTRRIHKDSFVKLGALVSLWQFFSALTYSSGASNLQTESSKRL